MKNRLVFILLLTFLHLSAQSDFAWQNYTPNNGLSKNSVKDIIKGKYGFIWIATENEITRFDVSQCITIDKQNNKTRFRNLRENLEKDSIFNVEETGRTTLFIKRQYN